MKKLITVFAFLALAFAFAPAQAQAKFGHLNSDELLSMMPETKEVQKQLEAYNAELESQLNTMLDEYKSKLDNYKQNEKIMTPVVMEAKSRELMDLENRIQGFQTIGTQDLQKKEVELLTPVIEKAQNAIDAVAKEKGLTYVFDTAKGTVVYADDSQNIMPAVKAKLGL